MEKFQIVESHFFYDANLCDSCNWLVIFLIQKWILSWARSVYHQQNWHQNAPTRYQQFNFPPVKFKATWRWVTDANPLIDLPTVSTCLADNAVTSSRTCKSATWFTFTRTSKRHRQPKNGLVSCFFSLFGRWHVSRQKSNKTKSLGWEPRWNVGLWISSHSQRHWNPLVTL